jgi:mRNA-degrading endonuclease YafQ of YafQ-DinJ toxin-antitoxin module
MAEDGISNFFHKDFKRKIDRHGRLKKKLQKRFELLNSHSFLKIPLYNRYKSG